MTTIAHYGIKGQHWGERRFQNEDGSLTPAGIRRYRDGKYDFEDNRPIARERNITGTGSGVFKRESTIPENMATSLANDLHNFYTKRSPESANKKQKVFKDSDDLSVWLYESGVNTNSMSDAQLKKRLSAANNLAKTIATYAQDPLTSKNNQKYSSIGKCQVAIALRGLK